MMRLERQTDRRHKKGQCILINIHECKCTQINPTVIVGSLFARCYIGKKKQNRKNNEILPKINLLMQTDNKDICINNLK